MIYAYGIPMLIQTCLTGFRATNRTSWAVVAKRNHLGDHTGMRLYEGRRQRLPRAGQTFSS